MLCVMCVCGMCYASVFCMFMSVYMNTFVLTAVCACVNLPHTPNYHNALAILSFKLTLAQTLPLTLAHPLTHDVVNANNRNTPMQPLRTTTTHTNTQRQHTHITTHAHSTSALIAPAPTHSTNTWTTHIHHHTHSTSTFL